MRRWRSAQVLAAAVLVLAGCVGPPRRSASAGSGESESATLQTQLEELSASLEALGRRLEELDTRTNALAEELTRARRAAPLAPVELAPPTSTAQPQPAPQPMRDFEVARISLGMLTGATDWDGEPGDDGVIVYLYPLDQAGDTVKRAGDFTFELFDLERSEKPLVMRWHIPAAEAAQYWQTFPGCYRFKLAWQGSPPQTEKPILKATFVTLSGQVFTQTKPLRVERPEAKETSP